MYILTILEYIDGFDTITYQKASDDELALKEIVVKWASERFWEADDSQSIEEQFEAILQYMEGGERDDPSIILRKSDD